MPFLIKVYAAPGQITNVALQEGEQLVGSDPELGAESAAPIATGVDVSTLNFRYAIQRDNPAWRPLRAFDNGSKRMHSLRQFCWLLASHRNTDPHVRF